MRERAVSYFAALKNRLMKNLILILACCCCCGQMHAQEIPAFDAAGIIAHSSASDTVYIINFWATWCAPCVHELPEFNALYEDYKSSPVKILMVSLDFKEDYPAKLALFLQRKKLKPQVVWLSDTDPNVFIPKIEPGWQGSIPATWIVQPGKKYKKFIEGIITEEEIRKIVDPMIR